MKISLNLIDYLFIFAKYFSEFEVWVQEKLPTGCTYICSLRMRQKKFEAILSLFSWIWEKVQSRMYVWAAFHLQRAFTYLNIHRRCIQNVSKILLWILLIFSSIISLLFVLYTSIRSNKTPVLLLIFVKCNSLFQFHSLYIAFNNDILNASI